MRVGAAESERVDADEFRSTLVRQLAVLAHDLEVEVVEGDVRIGRPLVQRRREEAAIQSDHRLQETCQSRDRFQMADVGLDRADGERVRPLLAKALAQGVRLDRIADPCAGSMRLDEAEVGRIHAEVAVDLLEKPSLRIGGGQ